jgi:predicted DNA-binding transcriptional regulator AlpA
MNHLVGVAEIASMLGVSRQRVDRLIRTDPQFPAPAAVLTAGRVWDTEAVRDWARRRGRAESVS